MIFLIYDTGWQHYVTEIKTDREIKINIILQHNLAHTFNVQNVEKLIFLGCLQIKSMSIPGPEKQF